MQFVCGTMSHAKLSLNWSVVYTITKCSFECFSGRGPEMLPEIRLVPCKLQLTVFRHRLHVFIT